MAIVIFAGRDVREVVDDQGDRFKYQVFKGDKVIWERVVHAKPTKTFYTRRINAGQEQTLIAHAAAQEVARAH